jgi:hypothetical protein
MNYKVSVALSCAVLFLSSGVQADAERVDYQNQGNPPSGTFAVIVEHDDSLATHTIYRPATLGAIRHPILVWGEGACADAGLMFPEFLSEIASYGVVVVADGPPVTRSQIQAAGDTPAATETPRQPPRIEPNGTDLIAALDWAFEQNRDASSPYYQKLDTTEVAAMGMSCGGLMSYGASADPRITTVGIWNSGLLEEDEEIFANLHQSVIVITGGESDIAYENGKRDFETIPDHIPLFYGVYPEVGHYGTYGQDNGGEFGRVAVAWLRWQLMEDTSDDAKGLFVGTYCDLCGDDSWQIGKKNMP